MGGIKPNFKSLTFSRIPALACFAILAFAFTSNSANEISTSPAMPTREESNIAAEGAALQEGDSVEIFVFEDPSFNGLYKIRQGGFISIPQVGNFKIARLTAEQAEKALKAKLEENLLRRATVSIIPAGAKQAGSGVVYVVGEVQDPGVLVVPGGETLTLLTAIIRAGGLSGHADSANIQLARLRDGRREIVSVMHYEAVLAGVEAGTELSLQDGDIINVCGREGIELTKQPRPSRGTVYLSGQVKNPGPYEIKDLTVFRTILRNGGFDRFANLGKVYVLRMNPDGTQLKIPVNMEAIIQKGALDLDIPIKDGDIIVVPEKFFSF